MSFDATTRRFRLETVHPGHSLEEVRDNTGFDFEVPKRVPETPAAEPDRLDILRTKIAGEIAKTYPAFASRVFDTSEA